MLSFRVPQLRVNRPSIVSVVVGAVVLLFLSLIPFSASAFAQQGPIAAYSFDAEATAGEDVTGDGHEATVEGATWTSHGRYGGAMEFAASEKDVLRIPDSPELDFNEEFTLEAWVRPSAANNEYAPLIAKTTTGSEVEPYFLYEGGWESNLPYGGLESETANETYSNAPGGTGRIPQKTWTHLALTFDGAKTRLYVNGKLVDEDAGKEPAISEGDLEIGGSTEGSPDNHYFDGRIDEVRVYNRALSAAEVPADAAAPIETAPAGPVADYAFDEEATAGEDGTGNGHEATIEGATWTTHGRYGGAMQFNGSSSCLSISDAADLRAGEEFTLESWVRPEGELKKLPVIFKEGSSFLNYSLQIGHATTGRAEGSIGTSGTPHQKEATATKELSVNTWSHLATTFDGANLRLYVNGALVTTKAITGAESGREGALKIGCDAQYGEHFKGRIDEARIYNRVLSEGEVQSDQAAPIQTPQRGPIAAYSFDAGEGTTVEDITGSGHTGTIENATWARGKYGNSLAFNGTNACVKVPVTEDLQATEEFTIEAWVRPEGTGATALPVIAMNDENSKGEEAQIAYELFAGNGQTPKAWVRKGGSSGTNNVYAEGALPEKAWSHIALTDNGSVIRLYVNGVLGKEENSTNNAPLLTAAEGPLSIGCGIEYGSYKRFKGRIDEVRVYNRALSGTEVSDILAPRFAKRFHVYASQIEAAETSYIFFETSEDPPLPNGETGTGVKDYEYRTSRNGSSYGEWKVSPAPYFALVGVQKGDEISVQLRLRDRVYNESELYESLVRIPPPGPPIPGEYSPEEGVPGAPGGTCAAEPERSGCPPVEKIIVVPTSEESQTPYGPAAAARGDVNISPRVVPVGNKCAVMATPPNVTRFRDAHTEGVNECLPGQGVEYTELFATLYKAVEGEIEFDFKGSAESGRKIGAGIARVNQYSPCTSRRGKSKWKAEAYAYTEIGKIAYFGSNVKFRDITC